jgi:serine protease Do
MVCALVFPLIPVPAAHAGASPQLEELSNAFANISEQASPAVVFIQVEKRIGADRGMSPYDMFPEDFFRRFFGPDFPGPQRGPRGRGRPAPEQDRMVPYGQGTGFIISKDGYIITNHHVVGDADSIEVKLNDGRSFKAELVGSDERTEIAVIKIDAKDLPTLPMGDSDQVRVGQWVVAIGNPFGLSNTVTAGIISARGRGNVGITEYADFIQTDAAINPGNSGGPLLDLEGRVIGVNTAIYSRSGGYMGIGFAIPINMVKSIKDQLIEKGTVARGYLGIGIQSLTPDLARWFGIEEQGGVLISSVEEGSPAERAGLKQNDVIISLNGKPAGEVGSFRSRIAATPPGNTVELEILRDGSKMTKSVTVGQLDEDRAVLARGGSSAQSRNIGLTVQNLSDELARRLGYTGLSGVVVTEVEPGSAAEQAGIESGDLIVEVNRQPVNNVKEFQEVVANSDASKGVLLLVTDGNLSRYVALRTDKK